MKGMDAQGKAFQNTEVYEPSNALGDGLSAERTAFQGPSAARASVGPPHPVVP